MTEWGLFATAFPPPCPPAHLVPPACACLLAGKHSYEGEEKDFEQAYFFQNKCGAGRDCDPDLKSSTSTLVPGCSALRTLVSWAAKRLSALLSPHLP